MKVTKVEIVPIRPREGLVGFASIEIDDKFYVSSIGVHKKRDGSGFRLTFPTKGSGSHNLPICHPTSPSFSKEIETAVIEKAQAILEPEQI